MHHQSTPLLSEGASEAVTGVLVDHITEVRLSSELVHSLGDLVSGSVPKSWEEGQELSADRRLGGLAEDNGVDVPGDGASVRHQTFGNGVLEGQAWV